MKKFAAQARFLWTKMRRRPIFGTELWWVVCPIDIVCNSLFTNHSLESFSWIDTFIDELFKQINSFIN